MRYISNRLSEILALLIIFFGLMSCEKHEIDDDFNCVDSGSNKLLIVPYNPDSNDTILAIETICGNESDVILDFQGQQIFYTRYFNSLMMMPCSPRPDTTVIGQLPDGQYQLVHSMIDKNHLLTDSIFLLDTTCLLVK